MNKYSTNKRKKIIKKRRRIFRRRIFLILILILFYARTLFLIFNYETAYKKIELKKLMQDIILTIEITEFKDSIHFDNSAPISNFEEIEKEINTEDLDKLGNLTLEEAIKIVNNELDFKIDKEGNLVEIK